MRPKSIVWFERLFFGTLCLGAIQSYLSWDEGIAVAANAGSNPVAFVVAIQVFVFALIGILTLLVSRRRNKVAMWISIALFAVGLPEFIGFLAKGLILGLGWIAVVQTVGQLIAFGLLFTPSSRRWMNREEQGEVFS